MQYLPVSTKAHLLAQTDSPSVCSLVILTVAIDSRQPTFGQLRNAVESILYELSENVIMKYYPCEYDCTGQSFTTSIDRIDKSIIDTGEETVVIFTYKHWSSIDV